MNGNGTNTDDAQALAREIQPERSEFEQALGALTALNGAELAQAGRLGSARIEWVKQIDAKAADWFKRVGDRLAPGKKKAWEAWQAWTRLETELTAPAKAIRERARPVIGQYQLELIRQSEIEAARLREEQRKAEAEQRERQEEEAARLRAAAEALAAEGDTAAAEEKQLEADYVAATPIVPVAVTAEQVAPKKIDAGRVVYWRRILNWPLFLNWAVKNAGQLNSLQVVNRSDDSNETTIEVFDWSITVKFGASWKSKGAEADIPGVAVTQGYEARARGKRS